MFKNSSSIDVSKGSVLDGRKRREVFSFWMFLYEEHQVEQSSNYAHFFGSSSEWRSDQVGASLGFQMANIEACRLSHPFVFFQSCLAHVNCKQEMSHSGHEGKSYILLCLHFDKDQHYNKRDHWYTKDRKSPIVWSLLSCTSSHLQSPKIKTKWKIISPVKIMPYKLIPPLISIPTPITVFYKHDLNFYWQGKYEIAIYMVEGIYD